MAVFAVIFPILIVVAITCVIGLVFWLRRRKALRMRARRAPEDEAWNAETYEMQWQGQRNRAVNIEVMEVNAEEAPLPPSPVGTPRGSRRMEERN